MLPDDKVIDAGNGGELLVASVSQFAGYGKLVGIALGEIAQMEEYG